MGNGAVTDALNPPGLAAWRERGPAPPAQCEQHPGQGGSGETATVSAVAEAVPPQRPKPNYQGFVEPLPWPDDRGKRRETVLDVDHNPPRVVRVVGWQRCIKCSRRFFSDDVRAVRMCRDCSSLA